MGKCVLVTGATGGLGKAISLEFAKNGYDVIINYHNHYKDAVSLEEEVKSYGVDTLLVKCDVSNEEEVKNMFDAIKNKFNHLDYLVNNAAIQNDSIFLDKTKEDFMKVYEVNLVGAFLCSKYAKDLMNDDSSIVNISSTNGIDTNYPYSADYDASKAALISLSNNLAIELAPIRVNTVAPGWINTDMNKELTEEQIEEENKKILLNRFADPDEIAKVSVFLCSSASSYINKSVIRVDGGYNG
jgi:3-oxoacyl-[acyl-carrier protein] reductase